MLTMVVLWDREHGDMTMWELLSRYTLPSGEYRGIWNIISPNMQVVDAKMPVTKDRNLKMPGYCE